jgi:hypothetical protein
VSYISLDDLHTFICEALLIRALEALHDLAQLLPPLALVLLIAHSVTLRLRSLYKIEGVPVRHDDTNPAAFDFCLVLLHLRSHVIAVVFLLLIVAFFIVRVATQSFAAYLPLQRFILLIKVTLAIVARLYVVEHAGPPIVYLFGEAAHCSHVW